MPTHPRNLVPLKYRNFTKCSFQTTVVPTQPTPESASPLVTPPTLTPIGTTSAPTITPQLPTVFQTTKSIGNASTEEQVKAKTPDATKAVSQTDTSNSTTAKPVNTKSSASGNSHKEYDQDRNTETINHRVQTMAGRTAAKYLLPAPAVIRQQKGHHVYHQDFVTLTPRKRTLVPILVVEAGTKIGNPVAITKTDQIVIVTVAIKIHVHLVVKRMITNPGNELLIDREKCVSL